MTSDARKKLTVPDLIARKKAGERVVMASIPDYPSAVWAERAGIDIAAAKRVGIQVPHTTSDGNAGSQTQMRSSLRRQRPNCLS